MRKAIPSILLLALVFLLSCSILAYADGQGNMDGGGSGMGQGTAQNFWSPETTGSGSRLSMQKPERPPHHRRIFPIRPFQNRLSTLRSAASWTTGPERP